MTIKTGIEKSILFFFLIVLVQTTTMTTQATLSTLAEQWKEIRPLKGHWQDEEYNKDIDGFNGKKHLLMKEMHELLKGSSTAVIMSALGTPDEVSETLEMNQGPLLMPGPLVPSDIHVQTGPMLTSGPVYLIYYWRGKHDYLWFKIESSTGQAVDSGWYNALD
jgi:hypothetical protein